MPFLLYSFLEILAIGNCRKMRDTFYAGCLTLFVVSSFVCVYWRKRNSMLDWYWDLHLRFFKLRCGGDFCGKIFKQGKSEICGIYQGFPRGNPCRTIPVRSCWWVSPMTKRRRSISVWLRAARKRTAAVRLKACHQNLYSNETVVHFPTGRYGWGMACDRKNRNSKEWGKKIIVRILYDRSFEWKKWILKSCRF